jgi:hypothetical protein
MEGDISNVPRWDDMTHEAHIYYLIPKVINNYEIRPMIWTFRP